MKYAQLVRLVEGLEDKWQQELKSRYPNTDPRIANGQIQFFDVENTPIASEQTVGVPIVIAIGANYAQNKTPAPVWGSPYLGSYPTGKPVAAAPPSSPTRQHLDLTFDAYSSDPRGWVDRCLASDVNIPASAADLPNRYILISTNFSPLITYKPWQYYAPQYRAHLLTLLRSGFVYLDNLLSTLREAGAKIHVFVGHGLNSEVPVLFRKWQTERELEPWLLTQNLGGRPFDASPSAFYKKSAPVPPAPPPPRKAKLLEGAAGDD